MFSYKRRQIIVIFIITWSSRRNVPEQQSCNKMTPEELVGRRIVFTPCQKAGTPGPSVMRLMLADKPRFRIVGQRGSTPALEQTVFIHFLFSC